jgi:hypothetical protein
MPALAASAVSFETAAVGGTAAFVAIKTITNFLHLGFLCQAPPPPPPDSQFCGWGCCVTWRNFCYFSVLLLGIWDLGDLGSSLT